MKVPFATLPLLLAVASASAGRYEISSISTSQQYAAVNNAWTYNALCIEVSLRVTEDIGKTTPTIKAYFYNKDREMVREYGRPTSVSFGDGQSFTMPESYKPGRKQTVYFGIPQNILRGKDKWKHVVVVFGDREQVAAEVYPKDDIQQFEFKEKNLLGKTAAPAQPAATAPAPTPRPAVAAAPPAGRLPSAGAPTAPTTTPALPVGPEKTMMTSTGMELVWIPPGEFIMGSTPKEKEWALAQGYSPTVIKNEGENPRRTKIPNGFWLSRTEVTVGQWRKFADAASYVTEAEKAGSAYAPDPQTGKWSRVEGASWRNPNFDFAVKDNHPVSCISWNDAVAFCEWLTETEKKANRLPSGMVCRLPIEAEWEYACRAGTQTMFWWGDESQERERRANMRGTQDGFEFVSPVDHYRARGRNKFGLADMLGNVWEWCLDDYDPEQPHEEYYKNNLRDRVTRGGCFYQGGNWRCAVRRGVLVSTKGSDYGFRVCCGVPR